MVNSLIFFLNHLGIFLNILIDCRFSFRIIYQKICHSVVVSTIHDTTTFFTATLHCSSLLRVQDPMTCILTIYSELKRLIENSRCACIGLCLYKYYGLIMNPGGELAPLILRATLSYSSSFFFIQMLLQRITFFGTRSSIQLILFLPLFNHVPFLVTNQTSKHAMTKQIKFFSKGSFTNYVYRVNHQELIQSKDLA